jgi:hypothetical protein|tara:strand:+ start:2390 stop:3079 length:690 start_codon:yes stop_codon:yes gene_type:complete
MVSYSDGYRVLLNLQSRKDGDGYVTNRIPLLCNDVSIQTGKTVMSFPVPFSGLVTGESSIASLDLGMADKTITLAGTIVEMNIVKKYNDNDGEITKSFTAFEIAQLIHSYVDSSFLQPNQNLNELILLLPSRVDKTFNYHTGIDETTDISNLPTIPFTYKVRDDDNVGALSGYSEVLDSTLTGSFPAPSSDGVEVSGLKGFIRNFSTSITGDSGTIDFNMDFQVATMSL